MPNTYRLKIYPVLMSFIVMGFVDIVGVSVGYVKKDFNLSDSLAQLIPTMAFVWFFLLSIPVGIILGKYGKKKILNLGMIITCISMLIPFIQYSFSSILLTFLLLGIGNTIVQVSANPMLHDVVAKSKFSSYMSLSQFIKAIVSLLGPIIVSFMASTFGDWKLVFAIYAITSVIAVLWLYFTVIDEKVENHKIISYSTSFKLLKNKYILFMVIGIFLIVGADVGMNVNIVNLLTSQFGLSLEKASMGISVYFTALMLGRFMGAILLNWLDSKKFLFTTSLVVLASLTMLLMSSSSEISLISIFFIGLSSANLFPLVFAITIERFPEFTNEISGLMITAVVGGAVIPPIIGLISTNFGVKASMLVILFCIIYVFFTSIYILEKTNKRLN